MPSISHYLSLWILVIFFDRYFGGSLDFFSLDGWGELPIFTIKMCHGDRLLRQ